MSVHVVKLPGNIWENYKKNGEKLPFTHVQDVDASVMREGEIRFYSAVCRILKGRTMRKSEKLSVLTHLLSFLVHINRLTLAKMKEKSPVKQPLACRTGRKRFCQDGNEYICAAAIELTKEDAALTPQTVRARRINDRDIEIYWDEMFEDGEDRGRSFLSFRRWQRACA